MDRGNLHFQCLPVDCCLAESLCYSVVLHYLMLAIPRGFDAYVVTKKHAMPRKSPDQGNLQSSSPVGTLQENHGVKTATVTDCESQPCWETIVVAVASANAGPHHSTTGSKLKHFSQHAAKPMKMRTASVSCIGGAEPQSSARSSRPPSRHISESLV